MARGKTDVPSIAPIKEKRTVGYYVRGFLKYFVLIFFSLCAVVPLISCITTAFKTTDEYKATEGRCNLQRVLRCKPLPHKPGDQDNGYLTLQVRRTYGKSVQPDLCRCYHIDHTGTYSIPLLSETDLQWYYTGCCKGLIIY